MIENKTKVKHHKAIINALDTPKTALLIAGSTNLSQHQVSRRVSELINDNRIKITGKIYVNRGGIMRPFNVYEKI